MKLVRALQTVDSHTEGNATRVLVGGVPVPPGATLAERVDWLKRHDDQLRRLLNFEPRGSSDMCSALVMPPIGPDADFSVLLLEQDEYVPMCGHCMIGVATTVVETGMVRADDGDVRLRFETLAGPIGATVHVSDGGAKGVTLRMAPSFLLIDQAEISTAIGPVRVDVAFGGDFYAIVNGDSLGARLEPDNEATMAGIARAISDAVNEQCSVVHPTDPSISRCYEVLFTTETVRTGDVRHAVVSPPGTFDRSPCGTGTAARLAAMFTRGQVGVGQPVRFEGLLGTCLTGIVDSSERRDGVLFAQPLVTGRAYLTGFHTFVLDRDDPFPNGYRIGPQAREQA